MTACRDLVLATLESYCRNSWTLWRFPETRAQIESDQVACMHFGCTVRAIVEQIDVSAVTARRILTKEWQAGRLVRYDINPAKRTIRWWPVGLVETLRAEHLKAQQDWWARVSLETGLLMATHFMPQPLAERQARETITRLYGPCPI